MNTNVATGATQSDGWHTIASAGWLQTLHGVSSLANCLCACENEHCACERISNVDLFHLENHIFISIWSILSLFPSIYSLFMQFHFYTLSILPTVPSQFCVYLNVSLLLHFAAQKVIEMFEFALRNEVYVVGIYHATHLNRRFSLKVDLNWLAIDIRNEMRAHEQARSKAIELCLCLNVNVTIGVHFGCFRNGSYQNQYYIPKWKFYRHHLIWVYDIRNWAHLELRWIWFGACACVKRAQCSTNIVRVCVFGEMGFFPVPKYWM